MSLGCATIGTIQWQACPIEGDMTNPAMATINPQLCVCAAAVSDQREASGLPTATGGVNGHTTSRPVNGVPLH